MTVRVRFAPSPTGPLHMGGVRTALFNYLFARKHKGTMILRIEDTDQNRYVAGAEEYIMESLVWCGIEIDEGIKEGGDFGPYRQSERKDQYKAFADQLIDSGWAYYAFDTPEQLEEKRKQAEGQNQAQGTGGKFSYDGATRMGLRNSLVLSEDEVNQLIADGVPYVIRFKFPESEEVVMQDLIRGTVTVNTSTLDDKVLFKSDGMPTYHLANVVDDHLMQITHVIRGEEWLPSLPLHVMLYKAFGWTATQPEFAHLPLILKPAGNGKLSKRDGDKLGFPVFPINWSPVDSDEVYSGYRESGYLPDAFVNILALLGWNPGTQQEVFSMDELIEAFSLERVGKSGSRFDPEKAKSINHNYIQNIDSVELGKLLKQARAGEGERGDNRIAEHDAEHDTERDADRGAGRDAIAEKGDDFLVGVLSLVKERMQVLTDFWDQAYFFYEAPTAYDAKMVKKGWKEGTSGRMQELVKVIQGVGTSGLGSRDSGVGNEGIRNRAEEYERAIKAWIEEQELGMGMVMNPLRLSLVGEPKGPGVFDMMAVLGGEESIRRIEQAIEVLG